MTFLGRTRELQVLRAHWTSNRSAFIPIYGRRTAQILLRPYNHLDAYFGRCFQRLCRESQPRLYLREGVRVPVTVGEYWDAGLQVTGVGVRRDNWTDLGECKWGDVSSLPALAAELEENVRRYPNARDATIGRRLFVRKCPARGHPKNDLRVHTLPDLYALETAGMA